MVKRLHTKKKYGIYWHTYKCKCGKTHTIPLFFFLFNNKIYKRCECGHVSCLTNIQYITIDNTDKKMKEKNKIKKITEWRYP